LAKLFGGEAGGTMCLTEPQRRLGRRQRQDQRPPLPDGTYAIRGTKIFITAGDHDLTDNIVHLVLARIEGRRPAPRACPSSSCPSCRRRRDCRTTSALGSIEHKMGLNGSSTCVLHFGENDACVGELVGTEEHVGMPQMFRLMNGARIAVALQGLAVASTAYLNALEYARERKQGAHVTAGRTPPLRACPSSPTPTSAACCST
jgi:alkylation response protein AidB-like acyl-CoA dehydrogenase